MENNGRKLEATCGMDVLTAITTRRSMRKFTDRKISETVLNTVLNAGFCAPSAHNLRPWHFVVIKEKGTLDALAQASVYAKMLPAADCGIVVCGDEGIQKIRELLLADCFAAVENMLLCAHGLGLGAVWCGVVLDSPWKKELGIRLGLPAQILPAAVIALGYPEHEKSGHPRFDESKIHREHW